MHDVGKGVADQGRRLAANEEFACFGSMIVGGRERSQGLSDGGGLVQGSMRKLVE